MHVDDSRVVLTIDPSSDEPVYQQIVNEVKRDVVLGVRRPGDRLETILELSKRLGVARPTVGQAYDRLANEGVVVTRKSQGTFIADPPRELLLEHGFNTLAPAMRVLISIGLAPEEIDTLFIECRKKFHIARGDERRVEASTVVEERRRLSERRRTRR